MKNLIFYILLILSISLTAQQRSGLIFKTSTDTNAWKSEIRFGNIRGSIASQTNLQNALNAKENVIAPSKTSQFWRGDKTWQSFGDRILKWDSINNYYRPFSSKSESGYTTYGFYLGGTRPIISDSYIDLNISAHLGLWAVETAHFVSSKGRVYARDGFWSNNMDTALSFAYQASVKNEFYFGHLMTLDPVLGGGVSIGRTAYMYDTYRKLIPGTYRARWYNQHADPVSIEHDGSINIPALAKFKINGVALSNSWGSITGTLSSQTDLQSALNAKQNSLGSGTTSQYLRGDLTWQPFSEVTDKYMLKFSGQALQDTVRSTRFFDGIQSTSGGGTTWNYHTVSFYSSNWSGGFQLQADVHSDTYLIRRIKNNVNQTWKQIALIDDITSANTTTTNYVDTQISSKTATIGYTFTETRDDVTDGNFNLTKFGNVVNMNFSFYRTAAENDNVLVYLGQLPIGSRPTSITYGTISPGNGTESGQIKIETDGVVSIHCGIANQTWYGNLAWIIINN